MRNATTAIARRTPWYEAVEVLVRAQNAAGYQVAQLTFVPYEDGTEIALTFALDLTAAQELIDSLWASGLRPTEAAGSAGALSATQKHLEDMRRLVFASPLIAAP